MQGLTPYYALGEQAPTMCCEAFENVQRFVVQSASLDTSDAALPDMARVELVTLYHCTGPEIQAVVLDGDVVGTWGEPLHHPIEEYFGAPPMGGEQ